MVTEFPMTKEVSFRERWKRFILGRILNNIGSNSFIMALLDSVSSFECDLLSCQVRDDRLVVVKPFGKL